VADTGTLLFRWPRLFAAGERSRLVVDAPDGQVAPLLWSESEDYARFISTFKISPEEAVRLVIAGYEASGAQMVPNFVVGRWYHIATDHVIGQASVGGFYVNGDTGEVRLRDDDRVIRFDAFDGDHIVATR
jgi:hypothetical protein